MPGYRAKFIGGLRVKPDTKITLTACVSMDYVQQTGPQFAAFSGLVIKSNRSISQLQIVVSDDLYRLYNGWTSKTPDEVRRAMADSVYSKWMDENWRTLSFFKDVDGVLAAKGETPMASMTVSEANTTFGISLAELQYAKAIEFKIIRWRTLVETPEYATAKEAVDRAFVEIPAFRSVVEEVARPHCAKEGHTLESVIEFLKEEVAVVAGPLIESEITYPSDSFNAAVIWALKNIFHKEVPYHGYSVEPRGMQALPAPIKIPDDPISAVVSEERLRLCIRMITEAAEKLQARVSATEVKVRTDGSMEVRFEYASPHGSRERSHSLKFDQPDKDCGVQVERPASSPK